MYSPIGAILCWEVPMAKRKRRNFTAELKADAVWWMRDGGRSIGQVARDLDLPETALSPNYS